MADIEGHVATYLHDSLSIGTEQGLKSLFVR